MGVTKQYLRYAPVGIFNLVGSAKPNVTLLELKGAKGRYCAVGACENVIIWDVRKGEKVMEASTMDSFKLFFLANYVF
jgi:U3 small nucleolar RNA-associated protein 12